MLKEKKSKSSISLNNLQKWHNKLQYLQVETVAALELTIEKQQKSQKEATKTLTAKTVVLYITSSSNYVGRFAFLPFNTAGMGNGEGVPLSKV